MVGVMELGDDFRAEVEQQMLLMSPQSTGASSSSQGSRLVVNMHARRDNGTHLEPTTSFPSEDLTAVPPVTATVPPSSSSAASSLKNRMWGLVADTGNVVAEQVDKHKDRCAKGIPSHPIPPLPPSLTNTDVTTTSPS